jgi:hypothetical protein
MDSGRDIISFLSGKMGSSKLNGPFPRSGSFSPVCGELPVKMFPYLLRDHAHLGVTDNPFFDTEQTSKRGPHIQVEHD